MQTPAVAIRLSADSRKLRLNQFNSRKEICWFGFNGAFEEPGTAVITFKNFDDGILGGGGVKAINGAVISAGFDAAFVLAGLGQYDVEVVVTLELSVKFLQLAHFIESLAFQVQVVKSAKNFSFTEGFLSDRADPLAPHLAIATGMIAPVS
jgi:acyl-coenzyme A thioesterase PaaI-like protein